MSDVRAPYPSRMVEIDEGSVTSSERTETNIKFFTRGEDEVADLRVANDPSIFVSAIVRVGSFDSSYRDVLIKDWFRPGSTNSSFTTTSDHLPDTATGLDWSPDGRYLAITCGISPYIFVYKLTDSGLVKIANPATLPPAAAENPAWSSDGQYLVVPHDSSPYFSVYKRSGDVLTKLANPATLPTSGTNAASFSPDGQYLSVTQFSSPFMLIYKRFGDTFVKLANPTSLPPNSTGMTAWSANSNYVFFSLPGAGTPIFVAYKHVGDSFVKIADAPIIDSAGDLAWDPTGRYLALTISNSPYLAFLEQVQDNFVVLEKTFDPPPGSRRSVNWSPNGEYLVTTDYDLTSDDIMIYRVGVDSMLKMPPTDDAFDDGAYEAVWSPDGKCLAIRTVMTNYLLIYRSLMGPISGPAVPVEVVP